MEPRVLGPPPWSVRRESGIEGTSLAFMTLSTELSSSVASASATREEHDDFEETFGNCRVIGVRNEVAGVDENEIE